jgi:hypothetical protein
MGGKKSEVREKKVSSPVLLAERVQSIVLLSRSSTVMTYSALVDTLYCRPFRSFNPSGILHSTRITFLQRSNIFVRFTRVQNGDETQD